MKGIVFDIKEFALNDGPGIRTTVFMKGCPLQCRWCHNPEGIDPVPQRMVSASGCRIAGREYDTETLAAILKRNADVFADTGGGVTFSGGEPLMQAEFIEEVIGSLEGIHVLLDTSGCALPETFVHVVSKVQHVYYDLKLIDPEQHLRWTGKSNTFILQNILTLDTMQVAYTIRVPLIPSVTDTPENFYFLAEFINHLKNPQEIHFLPYNTLAGAKYPSVGMKYTLDSELTDIKQDVPLDMFSASGIPVRVFVADNDRSIRQDKANTDPKRDAGR